jgi:serine/threonine protein kinase
MPRRQIALTFDTTRETYTVVGIEGEGGAARVYRVQDSEGKTWALKCLKPQQTTPVRTKRFLNELKFCQSSSHPNIVQIVDEGFILQNSLKCPFFVMPLYPSTLRKLLQDGIPPAKRAKCFSDMLDGVEAAHLQGVWHRDLKPENVLHDQSGGRLVVSDFGIAHFTAEMMHTSVETKPADRLANFMYAAPEQRVAGRQVDNRADIYALGLMLSEMFTGHIPQGSGYQKIQESAPEFSYLDEIVDTMIQQLPENRPSSIDEIKKTLIAKKKDFVSRQKIDQLRQSVVPSATVTDPLVLSPLEVADRDVRGDELVAILSGTPSPDWLRAFVQPRSLTYLAGTEPANWQFRGNEASVSLYPHLEAQAQMILNNFKEYVRGANDVYRQHVEAIMRARDETERRALQQRISEEERRRRLLGNLKI